MENNWEKITTDTSIYRGQLIRHFVDGREIQFRVVGPSSMKGFLEVEGYDQDGRVIPSEKRNKHNLAGWVLIERNFEIWVEKPSVDPNWPRSLKDEVRVLIDEMDDKQKEEIGKMSELDYIFGSFGLGNYVRNKFGLWLGNQDLINDVDPNNPDPDNISTLILKAVYKELNK